MTRSNAGKLAVDHPRDEQPAADVEEQVVLAVLVLNVAVALAKQAPELEQRLARQDDPLLFLLALLPFAFSRGTVMSASR